MSTVYVYVDGADLEAVESTLESAFTRLVSGWPNAGAHLVNQRHPRTPDLDKDDLPDWDLGINLPITSFNSTFAVALVEFAREISTTTGRELVVGVASERGTTEDLVFLGAHAGDSEIRHLCTHLVL